MDGNNPAGTHVQSGYTQPNILMIMVDQLRAARWLPSGGQSAIDALLPTIAAIRNTSFVFENYFVAATACTPSRATLMTGLYSQQTCMFLTQNADPSNMGDQVPSLGTGFGTFADALGGVPGYNVYWIGKWHLSDPAPGETDPGAAGPTAYGFTPTAPVGSGTLPSTVNLPPDGTIASPNGIGNLGTEGVNPSGYQPASVSVSGMHIAHPSYPLYNDAAIADWFITYWIPSVPTGKPWCTTVSFVNPHDITAFPYTYGLTISDPTDFGSPSPAPTVLNPEASYPVPPTVGSDAPAGSPPQEVGDEHLPALSTLYTSAPSGWNYSDNPVLQPYGTGAGKPSLQAAFQTYISNQYGAVKHGPSGPTDPANWLTFLNYYFWMQSCVDYEIGRVITAFNAAANVQPSNTIIVFTSDHGEYGGSHWMKAKGGALYDESMNVPLYVSDPVMRVNYPNPPSNPPAVRPYVCSSVDILPFFYTLALGNSSWRNNLSDPFTYLSGRENILDGIFSTTPPQRRLSGIANTGSGPTGTSSQPYVLHTTDEVLSSAPPTGSGSFPTHAIAFRTVDVTTVPQGGGKLGVYSYWPITESAGSLNNSPSGVTNSQTQPDVAAGQQFEFYNYTAGNVGETGNSWLTDTLAPSYNSAFGGIVNGELYKLYSANSAPYSAAFAAFSTYLSNTNNGSYEFPVTED